MEPAMVKRLFSWSNHHVVVAAPRSRRLESGQGHVAEYCPLFCPCIPSTACTHRVTPQCPLPNAHRGLLLRAIPKFPAKLVSPNPARLSLLYNTSSLPTQPSPTLARTSLLHLQYLGSTSRLTSPSPNSIPYTSANPDPDFAPLYRFPPTPGILTGDRALIQV
ncbi:hypothetical protein OF83DRAFT_193462 [Amylostereum chailletii]|nr:hypothetical protein OF83DRAFT_193462 [Amylostereum chailletii]